MSEEDDIRRGLRTLADNPPPVGPLAAAAVRQARAARSRRRAALVATALVVVAGSATMAAAWRGGGQPSTLATPSTSAAVTVAPPATTDPATPTVGTAYPYQLFVHCGVRYALFGGRWWEAMPQQSPPPAPPGRDSNYVTGTMTLIRADRAHFRSTERPLEVDFRPAAAEPPLCQ
jgi:hypothetical protein